METAATQKGGRLGLDKFVAGMIDPRFVLYHRRVPRKPTGGGHVDPAVLSLSPPKSRYVRKWRRHARRCSACTDTFRYLGLSLG